MSGIKQTRYKKFSLYTAVVFFLFGTLFINNAVDAADITSRSISLSSSFASAVVTHSFQFNTVTAGNNGSIRFLYCSNSPLIGDPCTPPAGLNVAAGGIFSQSGITGFSVSGASTSNSLIITKAPAFQVPVTANYSFSNITNPSTPNDVTYVRIAVFDNIDATGVIIDAGSVVFVTEDPFAISAYVPPYMTFCVGVTVAIDCSVTAGFLADFGEFSTLNPSTATTQFAVATNDLNGYNTFISGQTMTSGSNVIPGLVTQTSSQTGTSQFGVNLRSNSAPSVGANPDSGPVSSGVPALNYNSSNQFRFVTGDKIAGSTVSTGFNRYTVSYLVNVSKEQKPGVYSATLTYTSIASF